VHIPDGFLSAPVALTTYAASTAAVAYAVRRAGAALDDRRVPLLGVTAAFVFAAQMLNFPVANGTSGHLLGGVLAAVLVGPWAGALAVTVVLVVQALLFADGGLSALGLNVINMALAGAFVGYGLFVVLRKVLGNRTWAVTPAAGIAAFLVPVIASILFTVEYAVGGNDAVSVETVAAAMIGVHALIGIGEGIISGLAIGAVMSTRPDLVYGARGVALRPAPALQGVAA
jgi:cobalt/nickel transport system permease protein